MKQEVIQKAGEQPKQQGPNLTGIPTQMKLDFERRSGLSFDDVRVHYNSDKPARIGALAYTQGTQVHVGPGQEKHLRHELGHVVQQKRGIVNVTSAIGGLPLNDDEHLEHEADGIVSTAKEVYARSSSIVQRKLDVSVSLMIRPEIAGNVQPDIVKIDTIKLSGRPGTGLVDSDGDETQGEHTIADVFIKKYQKTMLKDRPLTSFPNLYANLFQEIIESNKFAKSTLHEDDNRIKFSTGSAIVGLNACNSFLGNSDSGSTLDNYRRRIASIIGLYNTSYAHSFVATHGVGSPGKGESHGMSAVMDFVYNGNLDKKVMNLIDALSIGRLVRSSYDNGNGNKVKLPRSIIFKFYSMMQDMREYKTQGSDNLSSNKIKSMAKTRKESAIALLRYAFNNNDINSKNVMDHVVPGHLINKTNQQFKETVQQSIKIVSKMSSMHHICNILTEEKTRLSEEENNNLMQALGNDRNVIFKLIASISSKYEDTCNTLGTYAEIILPQLQSQYDALRACLIAMFSENFSTILSTKEQLSQIINEFGIEETDEKTNAKLIGSAAALYEKVMDWLENSATTQYSIELNFSYFTRTKKMSSFLKTIDAVISEVANRKQIILSYELSKDFLTDKSCTFTKMESSTQAEITGV